MRGFRGAAATGRAEPSQIVINFNGPVGDKQGTAREVKRVMQELHGTGLS